MNRKNSASTIAVIFPATLPSPTPTAPATAVMPAELEVGMVTITPQVASR